MISYLLAVILKWYMYQNNVYQSLQMSDLGETSSELWIEFIRDRSRGLVPRPYINYTFKWFHMQTCSPGECPTIILSS